MQIALREANASDAELIYEVTKAAMQGYVEQAFGPWIESFQRKVIGDSFHPETHQVILVDGAVAGILAAPVHASHMQLEKLFILPPFQRRGIGSQLLHALARTAGSERKPIRLRVLAVNTDARRFYERFGFVITGRTDERIFMEYRPHLSSGGSE
jgi:GNAT superfamily N-acetyltransferase